MNKPIKTHEQEPIVSIIIPTAGERIYWLQRAVNSAISGWQKDEIEILIILNKNISKFQDIKNIFENNSNIKILISEIEGVSKARNVGLRHATGKLVRFLDDDDYLIPEVAMQQCKHLSASPEEISSYGIKMVDSNQTQTGILFPLDREDCVVSLSLPNRLQIPLSFVFKRELIQECKWQENLDLAEDTVWLLSILCERETTWIKSKEIVGVWFQHEEPRLSRRYPTEFASMQVARALINLSKKLETRKLLLATRKTAIANGLWQCYLDGYKYKPLRWIDIAKRAKELDINSQPDSTTHRILLNLGFSISVATFLLLPTTLLFHLKRKLYEKHIFKKKHQNLSNYF